MAESSEISWTDATHNEWIGCTRVSPGCQHCYAETLMDTRYGRVKWGKGQPRVLTSEANRRKPHAWNRAAERARKLWAQCGAVGSPPPRPRVFSASLSDWLDDEVDPAWLAGLLSTVVATPELDWLLLTKRPQLWRERVTEAWKVLTDLGAGTAQKAHAWHTVDRWLDGEAPANVWAGTTVEDQERADERIPHLLAIPARVRFLSCEPLLGPVDLRAYLDTEAPCPLGCAECDHDIGWIIAGGESGHGARPMHPAWARSLRDQAQAAGVAFHFKQWGEWAPFDQPWALDDVRPLAKDERWMNAAGGHGFHGEDVWRMQRAGKKAAGRELDGRTWDELPVVSS